MVNYKNGFKNLFNSIFFTYARSHFYCSSRKIGGHALGLFMFNGRQLYCNFCVERLTDKIDFCRRWPPLHPAVCCVILSILLIFNEQKVVAQTARRHWNLPNTYFILIRYGFILMFMLIWFLVFFMHGDGWLQNRGAQPWWRLRRLSTTDISIKEQKEIWAIDPKDGPDWRKKCTCYEHHFSKLASWSIETGWSWPKYSIIFSCFWVWR